MYDDMLGKLVRLVVTVQDDCLGTLCDLLEKLTSGKGTLWFQGLKKFLRGEDFWVESQRIQQAERLLGPVSKVSIQTTKQPFVAGDNFVINTSSEAKVKIVGLNEMFIKEFLTDTGKTDDLVNRRILLCYPLKTWATDMPQSQNEAASIPVLGGEGKVETTLAEMWNLIERHANGGKMLLDNCETNVFYIKNLNGVLRAVDLHWSVGGWYIAASSIESPGGWHGVGQVFSPKPYVVTAA
jgi:hypothetical protein